MYKIILSSKFDQDVRKLTRYDQKYKAKLQKTINLLELKVDQPSLRLHKLSGTNFYSVSIDKSIRIILSIEGNNVFLMKIGKHEDVY